MDKEVKQVCDTLVDIYGVGQCVVCIEELSELQKALTKYLRSHSLGMPQRNPKEKVLFDIIEEIGDVEMLLYQVKKLLDIDDKLISCSQLYKARKTKEMLPYLFRSYNNE